MIHEMRGTMFQTFHWYSPSHGNFWQELTGNMQTLKNAGFTSLWLPPAYKGMKGINDVGYGVYDFYDCGEFFQKGTTPTKYGTKQEYENCISKANDIGIHVYADIVINHKMGADEKQLLHDISIVDPYNRNDEIENLESIKLWTSFTFPGREGKYSEFQWEWEHFDAAIENDTIYKLKGKQFETLVDPDHDNYDFLMGVDLDFDNDTVKEEVLKWGKWYMDTFAVDGLRLDAVKHIHSHYYKDWIQELRNYTERNFFAVGEYWSGDIQRLKKYIHDTGGKIHLFDVPLHFNFYHASKQKSSYDMGSIFNNTLVKDIPYLAVTMVDNHDTQPLQSLESMVEDWFKPLAYAIILLRKEGYPCVFSADYLGATYTGNGKEINLTSHKWIIDRFLEARNQYTFGQNRNYLDDRHIIGWTFEGDANYKSMAVIMSNDNEGSKWMETGKPDREYRDITGHHKTKIKTNDSGWGHFSTRGESISVWVET